MDLLVCSVYFNLFPTCREREFYLNFIFVYIHTRFKKPKGFLRFHIRIWLSNIYYSILATSVYRISDAYTAEVRKKARSLNKHYINEGTFSHRLLYTWTEDCITFFPNSIPTKLAKYGFTIIWRYSKDMNFHKIWRV